jgi:PIN domain nuclease of toxin-antitoxin system
LKLLLDTHAFLWWLLDDPQLSPRARAEIGDPGNEIVVSGATAWEIATKYRLRKLGGIDAIARDIAGAMIRAGFAEMPVSVRHGQRAGSWPQAHRDPFDRMLAAQSALEDVPLVTRDSAFRQFGVSTVW